MKPFPDSEIRHNYRCMPLACLVLHFLSSPFINLRIEEMGFEMHKKMHAWSEVTVTPIILIRHYINFVGKS
jgi:hypothetical protein